MEDTRHKTFVQGTKANLADVYDMKSFQFQKSCIGFSE